MLPAPNRLRDGSDFATAIRGRGGARAGSGLLVVHAISTGTRMGQPPRVGLVVSKGVGGAVVRNRTKRRLRAALACRLDGIPTGVDVVVRAQPDAGAATFWELDGDLKPLLEKVFRRIGVSG